MPNYLSPGVYVEEVEAGSRPIEGVGTAVASFVGFAKSGPVNEPTLVTNWAQFTGTFGGFLEGSYLAHAVYGYFNNGGGAAYVIRVGADGADGQSGRGKGARKPAAALPATGGGTAAAADLGPFRVVALDAGGAGLEVEVVPRESTGDGDAAAAEPSFTLKVHRGSEEEVFEDVTTAKGAKNVATVVKTRSKLITIEEKTGVNLPAVAAGKQALAVPPPVTTPARIGPADYIGDAGERSGVAGLEAIDAVTMVSVPDVWSAFEQGTLDDEGVRTIQRAVIDHCEGLGDRMAILDPPPSMNAQAIRDWRTTIAAYDSKFATLYWPWVKVFDPASGSSKLVPPSGHIAGIWGRSDDTRGVHKAPANEVVRGAIDLAINITRAEHDLLNPEGINVIRAFPGRGIRVWGARTLSSDPAWRYVNVRRLFNFIEESVIGGTQWVVFEPNDFDLWQRIRRTISEFLYRQWRDGALFGAVPEQAFYVKCDTETNPPAEIDAGRVTCEIGVSPVKPAEFVVFRLAQFSGAAEITE